MDLLRDARGALGAVADRALDLALPAACAGCRREGAALCRECLPALDVRLGAAPGVPIGLPADLPAPLLQLEWCAPFTGVTRRALHALKYDGERRLAPPLGAAVARRWSRAGVAGDALVPVPASPDRVRERGYDQAALIAAEAARRLRVPVLHALKYAGERRIAPYVGAALARRWARAGAGGDVLVPVPASPDRVRDRGYDQAALIATEAGRRLGLPVLHALERTRATTAQFDLDRGERASNLDRAFSVPALARADVVGRWIVLVDDVVTTGATLAACATALLDADAAAVSAIAGARER